MNSTVRKMVLVGVLAAGIFLAGTCTIALTGHSTVAHADNGSSTDSVMSSATSSTPDGSSAASSSSTSSGDANAALDATSTASTTDTTASASASASATSGNPDCGCGTGKVMVVVNVVGGNATSSDFTVTVTGNDPHPKTFPGSASGTVVKLGLGKYNVTESFVPNYETSYSRECSEAISKNDEKELCTITNTYNVVQTGSISVCKVIIDQNGAVIDGERLREPRSWFPGFIPSASSSASSSAGLLPDSSFTTPLNLNTKLFGSATNNAQCLTYNDLALGHWYYGQEMLPTASSSWATPRYNDQFSQPANSTSDFYLYSGELYDNDPSNDGQRNLNSDGDIVLLASRPDRQLIVLNQLVGTSTKPVADIGVVKTVDNAEPHEGDTVHYTITASDAGPATSTQVSVADALPSGVTFVSATSSEGDYASSTGIWNVGIVPASSTATLVVTATVDAGTAGRSIANTATVSECSGLTDNNPANNSSTATINVQSNGGGGGGPTADLAITKSVDNATPHEGDTIHYTIRASDLGPSTSTNVNVNDVLPSGVTFISATSSEGSSCNFDRDLECGHCPSQFHGDAYHYCDGEF